MRKWLALALVALAGAAEAQPVSGGLLGRGASYSSFVPPSGCAAGYVPYFDASLKMVCSPTVYAPTTDTTTVGTLAARNVTVTALPAAGSITVTPTLSKVGSITTVAGASLVDGDYFTIEYAAGLTVPIEFDASPGDGTTGGRVAYVFAAGDTADQIRDGLIALLNAAAPTQLTASSGGAATVAIVLDTPGAVGGTNSENVANAGFGVTGFVNPTAATTYTYSLQACLADGTCNAAGAASTTAAGHATLSASNFNRLSWSAVAGAASYKIRRDVGGATQGVIWTGTALTVDDTGLAGDGSAKPTVDGTGTVTAQRVDALNGTLGTESRWYYNYASAANNEFGFASWLQSAGSFWFGTYRTGSGMIRSMYIGPASGRWMVSAANGSLAPIDSATQDIGTTTLLPRTIRASTSYEVRTTEGAVWTRGVASELITLSTAGTTTDSSANLLPANSIIESVVARVTTTITTATDWKLGDATTPGRFTAANSTLTAGTTDVGLVHVDQAGAAGPRQTTAAKVRVTTTGTPGAGVIRVTVFYRQFTPPAS